MTLLPNGKPPYPAAAAAFEAVAKARSPRAEKRALIAQLAKRKGTYALSSWRAVLRDLRTLLIHSGRERLVTLCVLSAEETAEQQLQYAQTLALRHQSLRPLSAAEFLDAAERAVLSSYRPALVVGLIALTGRRLKELWETGELEPAPGKGETFSWTSANFSQPRRWWLTFDGQAKARDREVQPYPIPTLAPADDVRRRFSSWRKDPLPQNAHWHREINAAAKHIFGAGMSSKELRAAYASVAAFYYRPAAMTETLFMAHVLGHRVHPADDPDLETALSYQVFSVSP